MTAFVLQLLRVHLYVPVQTDTAATLVKSPHVQTILASMVGFVTSMVVRIRAHVMMVTVATTVKFHRVRPVHA